MLIDFTVENYRSIKEPVTLSAVAQTKTGRGNGDTKRKGIKPDDEIAPPFVVPNRKLELLPVLGIFGANDSGKTNTLSALDNLLIYIEGGRRHPVSAISKFVPFFTEQDKPTRFELRLAFAGNIFTYTLETKLNQITLERLEYVPAQSRALKNLLWFERVAIPGKQGHSWRNNPERTIAYQKSQELLRNDIPFLSTILINQEPEFRELRSWLTWRWSGLTLGWEEFDRNKAKLVSSIWTERKTEVTNLIRILLPNIVDVENLQTIPDIESQENNFGVMYEIEGRRFRLPINEVSTGGQRIILLAHKLLHGFEYSSLVMIDELGSNIHPNITKAIARLFQNPQTNPKRAQLIFTSHDNTLQRGNLLRRDQIWFTQKRADGSTDLYPLTDFHPRNDLALDKAYLDGRFGAIPLLPSDEELLASTAPAGAAS
jgi:AAA15 family ATPase/GTPase